MSRLVRLTGISSFGNCLPFPLLQYSAGQSQSLCSEHVTQAKPMRPRPWNLSAEWGFRHERFEVESWIHPLEIPSRSVSCPFNSINSPMSFQQSVLFFISTNLKLIPVF